MGKSGPLLSCRAIKCINANAASSNGKKHRALFTTYIILQ